MQRGGWCLGGEMAAAMAANGCCHMLSHVHVAETLHFDNHAAVAEHVINNGSTRVGGCPTLQYAAKDGCACFSTTL